MAGKWHKTAEWKKKKKKSHRDSGVKVKSKNVSQGNQEGNGNKRGWLTQKFWERKLNLETETWEERLSNGQQYQIRKDRENSI